MQPVYRTVFGKAWDIMIRNKYLWILGLFSSLIISDGELSVLVRAFDAASWQQAGLQNLRSLYDQGYFQQMWENMRYFTVVDPAGVSIYAGLAIVIMAVIIFIVIVAQSALVYSVAALDRNKKPALRESVKFALGVFWKILGVHFFSKLTTYFLVITIAAPLFVWLMGQTRPSFFSTFILFFIIVPLAIIISFINKYAMVAVITHGRGILDALYEGWAVFLKNWFISLEMAVTLLAIHLLAVFVVVILGGLAALPFMLLMMLSMFLGANGLAMLFLLVIAAVLIFLVLGFSAGLSVFQFASWTILFDMLVKGKAMAKLERLLGTGTGPKPSLRRRKIIKL